MKEYLDSLDIEKYYVGDVVFDFKEYNVISISKDEFRLNELRYTGKIWNNNQMEHFTVKQRINHLLLKGKVIYCDEYIYYKNCNEKLPQKNNQAIKTEQITFNGILEHNKTALKLIKYIEKVRKDRADSGYEFIHYLKKDTYYQIILGYIKLYNLKIFDRNKIESLLQDKVTDVQKILGLYFSETA